MARAIRWGTLAAAVLVLSGACSSPAREPPRESPPSTVTSPATPLGDVPARPRPGPVTDARTDVREIVVAGQARSYLLHMSARPVEGTPLLLVLHGKGGSAQEMERYTGLNAAADAAGVAVAYLQGRYDGWAAAPRPTALRPDPAADVDFARAVIDELVDTAAVDPERVYVAGFSAGGAMALRLAAEHPGWFAAAASVAGQLPGPPAPVRPTGPIPVLSIYGDADPLRPIGGLADPPPATPGIGQEPPIATISTADTVAAFCRAGEAGELSREDLPAAAPPDGTSVSRSTCANPETGLRVTSLVVHGGGHTWPGGEFRTRARTVGVTSRQLSAATTVLDFLVSSRG
jgi:polyhydroxybutyrate depolymerase